MQNSTPLYILDSDYNPRPVSWSEYDEWEEKIPKEDRTALGRRLRLDVVDGVSVVTLFVCTPTGFFGRKPQLWMTLAVGDGVFQERRYSSHRAAIAGHLADVRERRRLVKS